MNTKKLKNALFLLIAVLMIFVRSASAQNVLTIQGNISDVNGSPIVNHIVTITGSNTPGLSTFTYTDSLGDYLALLTVLNMQGALTVSIADCNGLVLTNSHFWSPQITTIISNFVYCSNQTPCTLWATVTYDSTTNTLIPVINGTPPYTFQFSGSSMGPPFFYTPGWCLYIVDANGCDTTICDTSNVLWPCAIPNLTVDLDSNTNVLEVNQNSSSFTYLWSNGDTLYHTQYYPNWCVYVVDLNGCDTTICDTTTSTNPCQAHFLAHPDSANPNTVWFYDLSQPQWNIVLWHWDFGDNSTSTLQNPQHTYNALGAYNVCLTVTAQASPTGPICTSTFCDIVMVGALASCHALFQSTQVNASDSTHFFNTSFGTTASTTYFWDFGDGNTSTDETPVHLYASSGYYTVCLVIATTNCIDTTCHTIYVSIGTGQPCTLTGVSVSFDSTTNMLEATWGPNFTYLWSTASLSTTHGVPYYPNWCVHIVNTNGCDTTICETPFPCAIPFLHVLHDTINNILEASQVSSNFTYSWSNGTTTHHTPYYPNWCLYVVDTSGCDTTICEGNTNPVGPCQVEIDGDSIICNWGDSILLEASPTASSTSFVSYVWSTGTTGHILSTTANFPGLYSVIATDSSGCVSTASFTVAVEEIVIYSVPSPPHICLGDSIVMWLNPVLPINNIIWVPTGDTTTTIVEFPTVSTTYIVEALDANGCERRGEIFVIVDSCITGPCHAMFYFSPGFQPNTFEFYDYSTPNPTSWFWDFGDGTTSNQQNPIHTYSINVPSGFYLVCLTITTVSPNGNMCTSTYCDSIYLQNMNNCHASFYYIDLGNNTAHFTNTSMPMIPPPGHIIEFDLDYGDGTIDYNIGTSTTHTYPSSGAYIACLTMWVADSSGTIICTDTFCHSVTVTSGPIPCHADFTYHRDSIVINNPNGTTFVGLGNIFYFIDLSMPIGMISTWSWDMGDFGAGTYHQGTSSSSQFPVYEYDTSGTYYACLTITTLIGGNICSSTYCDTILAYPSPPPTGIIAYDFIKKLNIYPNPANDKLAIDMQITESGTVQINFINMMGQKLSQQEVSVISGQTKLITDVSHFPNGVHTIEFVVNNSKLYKRVIISK